MKLSLCVTTEEVSSPVPVALLSGTFGQRLDKAARLGFDGVELMTVRPAAIAGRSVGNWLRKRGLGAAAVASGAIYGTEKLALLGSEEVSRQAAARLNELVDFAAAVGAPVVTVGSFRGRLAWAGCGPDARARLAEVLAAAAGRAARLGVRLALEALNRYEADFLHTAGETLAFVQEIGEPALGVLLDTYHMNIEEVSPEAAIRKVAGAGRLYHVHLGDSNRLPPGQGHVDFRRITSALREAGYTGYLSAELLALPDPDTAAELTVTYMRQFPIQER